MILRPLRFTCTDTVSPSTTLVRSVPGDDRCRLEAELGGDVELRVAALGEGVLPGQRRLQRGRRDVGAALGMAGDADGLDAVLVEQAGLEDRHGAVAGEIGRASCRERVCQYV